MSYDPATLRPGDIVLVEGRGPLAAAIRWSTGCPFTHAALVGRYGLYEALWRVERSPVGKYTRTGWPYRPRGSEEGVVEAALSWARNRLGLRYGVRELLDDAERFDLHIVPRPRAVSRYTCSGFIATAYLSAGLRLTYAPWPAPSDLAYSPVLAGPRPWAPLER